MPEGPRSKIQSPRIHRSRRRAKAAMATARGTRRRGAMAGKTEGTEKKDIHNSYHLYYAPSGLYGVLGRLPRASAKAAFCGFHLALGFHTSPRWGLRAHGPLGTFPCTRTRSPNTSAKKMWVMTRAQVVATSCRLPAWIWNVFFSSVPWGRMNIAQRFNAGNGLSAR